MILREVVPNLIKNYTSKYFYKKPKIMTCEETIKYILEHKCSISRFGDGEIRLMKGFGLTFQDYSKELSDKLKTVKNTAKNLVCIPKIFNKDCFSNVKKDEIIFWKKHLSKYEYYYRKHFNQEIYGDSLLSRFYIRYVDRSQVGEYVKLIKQLWNDRNIVFVEGENSRLGYGNDLFDNSKSIRRIICPKVNAFAKYDEIKEAIAKHCNKDDLVIIALGATATALAYELSEDFQCLDLGHIDIEYEWFRMGVDEKTPVKNKHVNECDDLGDTEENLLDKKYLEEIIEKVN